ncbi:protein of unknown function (DUF1814) [Beggiatoa alba B18LD]|uniref:Nucleotidyl transferase AbiEii/AbiGii toxin family protein n=1 Tax=Beggiatoa alba B18LD TaxID=395493 RepID=I3CHQ6_9GAMM|nr:nucleotidyl transferase AbiEii/AbiGii toxin family protein [Beggiatoa alba]EIJ43149.1 protein of unknown function (DUF1814) [Beggiatoa alba B18LD]
MYLTHQNIEQWVSSSPQAQLPFRQAIHIILKAISNTETLRPFMIMKGGMLLGIFYQNDRYTKDIDFSTGQKLADIDVATFLQTFNDAMDIAETEVNYGMKCKCQSHEIKPNAIGTFPTIVIKIGYAYKNGMNLKQLEKPFSTIIQIDYSLNEPCYNIDSIYIDSETTIQVYALIDVIAEKFRSVLQQKIRKRNREQDIYDLNFLIDNFQDVYTDMKYKILDTLHKKSIGKNLEPLLHQNGMRDPEVKRRSGERYQDLTTTVESLPAFEPTYEKVTQFFESLPWDKFNQQTNKSLIK